MAEEELILLSAGTAARRRAHRERAMELTAVVDWRRLAGALHARRLLPTLGPRLLELAGERADGDFAQAVQQATEDGRRQGAFLQMITLRLQEALAEAGIRSAPLKGPMLGEAIHGDPGRRPASDIDLLVAPDQLAGAVAVVRELGYGAPSDHVRPNGLPLLHFALVHERGELPPVELHWRIHWYEQSFALDRLLPPADEHMAAWRPAPAPELVSLLLFYARDGFVDLRMATDVGAWWDAFASSLQPGAIDELMLAYPELRRAVCAAAAVTERLVGLPSMRALGRSPRLGLRSRAAARLANPNRRGSLEQTYADVGLIDGLLAPRGDFRAFLRRQVFPPRPVLDERVRYDPTETSSPLGHGARVLARYGWGMTRVVRPRTDPVVDQ